MSNDPPPLAKPSVAAAGTDHDALPPGTRFGEFEIIRVLGVGGFGIVYLAKDHSLEREVALKEYMPGSLAARGIGPQLTVRSSSFAETYAIGLRSFVNEARLLARFDHPSLVKVYRFWEDNATAYMVMPFLHGTTLRDIRRSMSHSPTEAWVRSVITPILSALELLHREGVYHRDIAPDNILLPRQGPPVLLDFGAARRVISDRTQSLTAILKPSYAPIEQYAEMAQLRQGPWTDLYALGAVVHYLLFGVPPAPATARAVQDDGDAIETRIVPGVSPRFLEAMSWMLAIRPNQRPQSGEQLRAVLDGRAEIPQRRAGTTIPGAVIQPAAAAGSRSPAPLADATRADTAFAPTALQTARVVASAPATAPTYHPVGAMPSARAMSTRAGGAASSPPGAPVRPSPGPSVSASAGPRLGWLALAGGGTVIAIAMAAAWQFAARRDAGTAEQATGSASASSAVATPVAAPIAAPVAATALPLPAATPVPLAIVAPAASAPLAPSPAPVPEVRALPQRTATTTAAAVAPQSIGERSSAANAAAPASAGYARPPGRPVPKVGGETTMASTRAAPPRTSNAPPNTEPKTVREACGNRTFLALAACMDRRCEEARFRSSSECVAILARKASRDGQALN